MNHANKRFIEWVKREYDITITAVTDSELLFDRFFDDKKSMLEYNAFIAGYGLTNGDLLVAGRESYQKGFQEGMKWCIEKLPTLRALSDEQIADMLQNIKEKVVI